MYEMVPFKVVFIGKKSTAGFALKSFDPCMAVFVFFKEIDRAALLATYMASIFAVAAAFEIQPNRMVHAVLLLLVTTLCQIITESYLAVVTFKRAFRRIMPR